MKSILKYLFISAISMFLYSSCGGNPKVISAEVDESSLEDKTGIFASGGSAINGSPTVANANKDDVHTVVVKEILPTSKYVYLFVTEGGGEGFWIATTKQEVEEGETYFYKGGLLKTNFESKEHNRIFDRMYLVSRLVPVNHGGAGGMNVSPTVNTEQPSGPRKIDREGSMKIADLVDNPQKYEGQTVQISGECVKVNPNIMGRNWIHLKDGSKDEYDLVITSDLAVPEGHVVTMKGIVVLNKDFGAGYRYQLIIEDGVIVR